MSSTRCGFIAVIGAPNAGKSTLINQLVGTKVSIVTQKVQTTRIRIMGISIRDECQLIFVDTPGIFEPRQRFDRAMIEAAWRGAVDADKIILIVDSRRGIDDDLGRIIDGLRDKKRTASLILNKIDLIKREKLLELASRLDQHGVFEKIFMISALKGDGVDYLFDYLTKILPVGPWMFPEDQISDLPQRLFAAEITREKIFLLTHQEVPYAITVESESWEEFKDDSLKINQIVYVQRESQKAIILGKHGSRMKEIGTAARSELAEIFGCKVHLFIHVKVRNKWMDDRSRYSAWGLNFNA